VCTLGEVWLTALPYPENYELGGMVAKGQLLPIWTYTALFSLIGTTYGGDGTTNFALPNLTGQAPANLTYMICTDGLFPQHI